uniref:Reverse transcriptase domain-containing protein n=1 Tax=Tanacetum cinerariifolium TaxID=118510 RepID=A0A699HAQ3_TANCI|nr:reverse transcriptase domain-containing protein [Tanacetum cinerariifolium]
MSTNEQTPLSQPTSAVRNTLGKEQAPQNLVRPISDEDLRECCDKNYHQILPIIAEKLHQEKAQQEKLQAVKARLNFEEASWSGSPEPWCGRSKSPMEKDPERRTVFKILEKGVFHRLGDKEKNVSAHSRGSERKSYYSSRRDTESCYQSSRSKEIEIASKKQQHKREYSRRTKAVSESEGKTVPFTPRIRYFDFPKARMPSHIKTYDGSEYPKDHLKIFQAAAKTKRWAMPTWCHMFNSTLTENARVWFDDLPNESIDSYDDLRKAFLENYLQQKKCIKDPVEIHNIKQRDGESTKEFVRRYNLECREEAGQKQNFKRGNFQNEQRTERKQDRFTLLTETPKEILALDKGEFKLPPPMTTPIKKRNASKFYEFHGEVGHTTDEWEEDGTEGPMIIEAEMGGHCMHRMIIGRPGVRKIREIPSMAHEMLKFPMAGRIVTLRSSRIISLECSMVLEPGVSRPVINQVMKENIQVAIHLEYPEQTIAIGSTLTEERRKELCRLLRRHLDAFAWKPTDMTKVPRHIAELRLNVREGCLPVRQKKRGKAPERNKAINEEVKKLIEADITIEVHYHNWLSNPVMIGQNLEVYVDDLVIKSRTEEEVIKDIEETFKTLKEINMKLNPKKCAFGMREDTFLGYTVDADGLRVCPDKVEAVLDLPSIKCLKDVQKLNEKLASLNRFLSKSAEISLPFFKTLKKCINESDFQWTAESEMEFKGMKQLITELPMLTAPKKKRGVDYVSGSCKRSHQRSLDDRKGREAIVITDQPIKQLLSNPEVTGRPLKWRFKLGEHDIQDRPRTSVKGQILADFIMERPEDDTPDTSIEDTEELPNPWILFTNTVQSESNRKAAQMEIRTKRARHSVPTKDVSKRTYSGRLHHGASGGRHTRYINGGQGRTLEPLELFTDGSSCIDGSRAGLIITNPKGMEFTYALRFRFYATNNEAEYEALIAGLWIAGQMGAQNLQANVDSKLVANQGANVLVERANKNLGEGIKAQLGDKNKNWVEEISHVLWAHRTMIKSSNGKTPFSLTYGAKAVILAEIGMPTLRTAEVVIVKNSEALGINLDLLEEKREQAAMQKARSKAKMERYYNVRV